MSNVSFLITVNFSKYKLVKTENQFANYAFSDMLYLFYIHGECSRIVGRTCRLFNERFPSKISQTFFKIETNQKLDKNLL